MPMSRPLNCSNQISQQMARGSEGISINQLKQSFYARPNLYILVLDFMKK